MGKIRELAWHLRQWHGLSYPILHPWRTARFLFVNRETTNFTYEISNVDALVKFLAGFLGVPASQVAEIMDELRSDEALRRQLRERIAKRTDRNRQPRYGRRLGWYAVTRLLRPPVVIETGTHDGLGAAVFARALEHNATEGQPGKLLTFDIDPNAGWLVPESLRARIEFVRGPIAETLPTKLASLPRGDLGLLIHDSDHRYEHEMFEFQAAFLHLRPGGVLLTDNAHVTTALQDFAAAKKGHYGYWQERPRGHPYPGGGIGAARWPIGPR